MSTTAYDLHTHYLQAYPEIASTTFSILWHLLHNQSRAAVPACGDRNGVS
jgi:hypothetical protein